MGGGVDKRVLLTVLERHRVVDALRDRPLDRSDIQSEFGVSRSTTHRLVHRFEDLDIVTRVDGGYKLTAFGRLVSDEVDRALETVRTGGDLSPLLDAAAAAAAPVDPSAFETATITHSDPPDPLAPVNRLESLLESARVVRAIDRSTCLLHILSTGERDDVEFVCPPVVAERGGLDDGDGSTPESQPGFLRAYVTDDVPFALAVTAERVCVGIYDDADKHLETLVDTDDPDALDWGTSVYDAYRERASPLTDAFSGPDSNESDSAT